MAKKLRPLKKQEISKLIKTFPDWKCNTHKTKCSRVFTFQKHIDALIFIARISVNAEIVKHYPEITFTHCKVKIAVWTSQVKALTAKDVILLKRIEMLYRNQKVDR